MVPIASYGFLWISMTSYGFLFIARCHVVQSRMLIEEIGRFLLPAAADRRMQAIYLSSDPNKVVDDVCSDQKVVPA